jgi:hypothetical protein
MKVKMLTQISGVRDGKPWPAEGDTIDVPADEAKSLCESLVAEPVDSRGSKTETAKKADTSEKRTGTSHMTKAAKKA